MLRAWRPRRWHALGGCTATTTTTTTTTRIGIRVVGAVAGDRRRGMSSTTTTAAAATERRDVYTHGHAPSVVQSHALRTAESCAAFLLDRGALDASATRLLDVGCGPGSITAGLAARCARVDAVDVSGAVLEQARAAAADAGVADKTFFQEASAYELPFADDSFDVVYAHQVLQHVSDPVGVLREMRRVVKGGGKGLVAVRDADYSSMLTFPVLPDIELWRATYREVCYRNNAEPDAGRHLLHWARQAGFVAEGGEDPVQLSISAVGYTTPAQCLEWGDAWKVRALESDFSRQAVDYGLATRADMERISRAWATWARSDSACFYYVNGELLAAKQ